MSNVVHSNENYEVQADVPGQRYAVLNTKSGVVEAEPRSLPEAISYAEQCNGYLVNSLWEWFATQAKEQRIAQSPLSLEAKRNSGGQGTPAA